MTGEAMTDPHPILAVKAAGERKIGLAGYRGDASLAQQQESQ